MLIVLPLHVLRATQTGTPRTHRRYLSRADGTYGPIPAPGKPPLGMLGMPFNSTDVPGLYCVGDSCFPGQVRADAALGVKKKKKGERGGAQRLGL